MDRGAEQGTAGAAGASAASPAPHVLTFRVMRLTAPLPNRCSSLPFVATAAEVDGAAPDALLRAAPTWEGEGAPCGVGALTVLPSSFGSIYASETFRSFISVFNRSTQPAEAVSVSIHMQTSSQRRIPLVDSTRSPRSSLDSRASINNVVDVALPELGVHVLVCAASYREPTSTGGHMRTLRQFFRFNVLPPLEPSLSVMPLYRGIAHSPTPSSSPSRYHPAIAPETRVYFLVDLRVLNAMPVPVYATSATLIPRPAYSVVPLLRDSPHTTPHKTEQKDDHSGDSGTKSLGARHVSMGVGDSRNFLFSVSRPFDPMFDGGIPTEDGPASVSARGALRRTDRTAARPASSSLRGQGTRAGGSSANVNGGTTSTTASSREIGHLAISWRSALGEVGHLENVVVAVEPVPRAAEVELHVAAVPQDIRMQHPFTARCIARNNTSGPLRLYLQVRRDLVGEVVPVGVSGVSLGEIDAGHTAECMLTLIPLARGQHSISGLRVVDIDSKKSYKADPPIISVL